MIIYDPHLPEPPNDEYQRRLTYQVTKALRELGTRMKKTLQGMGDLVVDKMPGYGIKVDTEAPTFGWRDIIGQIGVKTSGSTDPVWTVYRGSIYAYTFDTATAEAFMVFHIPHDYVPGSDLFVHAHWSQIVVDTGGAAGVPGNIEWKFDITYADGHGTAGGAADPLGIR